MKQKNTEDKGSQQAQSEKEKKDREKQQSQQQWLRRIDDDPGGLLKHKFRRQHINRRR